MNTLLNVHDLIWLFEKLEKLSKKATAVIKDSNNIRIISIVNIALKDEHIIQYNVQTIW